MKLTRFAAFLALVSVMPSLAIAAGSISITNLTGQARAIVNGETVILKSGSTIEPGAGVETGTGSSAELTLSGGVKLVLSSGTRLRIKSFDSAPGLFTCETVLLRGNLTGDATGLSAASNMSIRTTAGVTNVAGASFGVSFKPSSLTAGSMGVVASQGTVNVLPVSATGSVSVPAGSALEVGATGGSFVVPASAETLAALKAALAGGISDASGDISVVPGTVSGASFGLAVSGGSMPNLAVITANGKLITISPNGEGSHGL